MDNDVGRSPLRGSGCHRFAAEPSCTVSGIAGIPNAGPVRVQLRRTKGWRMPENTVSVARPGIWGNPFSVLPHLKIGQRINMRYYAVPTAEDAVACFREMLGMDGETSTALRDRLPELRGKNLACWCPLDQPCHADVLLELANAQGIEAGTAATAGRGPQDESPVPAGDAPNIITQGE